MEVILMLYQGDDDDIGAVDCGWVIQCDFWCDTDDKDVDDDGDDAMFGSADVMLDSYRDFFW